MFSKKFWLILISLFLFATEMSVLAKSADLNFDNEFPQYLEDANPNVGVISIVAPPDTVDSNTFVAPSAIVENFGDTMATFPVIFRDAAYSYIDVKQVTDLPPESTAQVNFNQWRIRLPRGIFTVKCSTALANDVNNSNDALEKTVFCRVKDIAVLELCLPDTVDSGSIVTPRARIKNLGNTQELYWAFFKIGTFYSYTLEMLSPLPGNEETLTFPNWTANVRGIHPVSCSTALAGDVNLSNNFLTGTLAVRSNDFGVTEILSPTQIISPHSPVIPEVVVTNYGTTPAISPVIFVITDSLAMEVYRDSNSIALEPGSSDHLSFSVWIAGEGQYLAKAYTKLSGDVNPNNDTCLLYFYAGTPNRDVGVIGIISPIDTIQRVAITPKAEVKNFGNLPESFATYCQIFRQGDLVYFDSMLVSNLLPGRTIAITFSIWEPIPGDFMVKCSTALVSDMNRTNDAYSRFFTVETLPLGWSARKSLPQGPGTKPKAVKAGGSLVYVPPASIYAFKGNNTNEFYCYDIPSNSWATKETIPWVGKKKRVKAGGQLCYDNERFIYALKGGNTLEFWRYDTQTDSWAILPEVPIAASGKAKKVKAGASLAFVPVSETQHFIYLLKGNGTFEFYAYSVENGNWLTKPDAPSGPDNKKFKAGSGLAYDFHRGYLWTIKGGSNEFYAYNLSSGTWVENLPGIPLIGREVKKRKIKDGGAIAYHPPTRSVYVLKGGNTGDFWRYNPAEDTWRQLDDLPASSEGKKVKSGGALIYAAGNLYALRGNKTLDFFVYNFGSSIGIEEPKEPTFLKTSRPIVLKVYPNPLAKQTKISYQLTSNEPKPILVTFKLYNASGQLVKVLLEDWLAPGRYTMDLNSLLLPNGIYILRMTALDCVASEKVIITR